MSEEMAASTAETTGTESTATATEVQAAPAAQAVETQATETQAVAESKDYSWVPNKFLNEGEPDFQNLAKAYQNLEKKLGQKVTNLAPETVDEYAYEPEGFELDQELTNAFKNEAKEAGLSTSQYEFIMKKYQETVTRSTMTPDIAADILKQSWGDAEFEGNLGNARKAFDEFAPSDMSMDDPALNHPSVLKLLANIGSNLGEDSTPAKSSRGSSYSQADIEEMQRTPDYNVRGSETRNTVDNWYKTKYA